MTTNLPSDDEKRMLTDMRKAGRVHKAILLVSVLSFLVAMLLPMPYRGMALLVTLIMTALLGISYINMQFFQQCPRCRARLTLIGRQCGSCGMLLIPAEPSAKRGNGTPF